MNTEKIIITGGPGCGKSSIIAELEKRGYPVAHEKAREVIQEQIQLGSNKVPWDDILGFSRLVVDKIVSFPYSEKLYFMDRSSLDVEGYLRNGNVEYDKNDFASVHKSMTYNKKVFFAPFWKEIYTTDEERKETDEEALQISAFIKSVYIEYGFELIDIPKLTIEKRTDFILSELSLPLSII
jgi:predicted ATPase